MIVTFKDNYSDQIGSFRRGWQRDIPDALAQQLIASGVAEPAIAQSEPETKPVKPKRQSKPKVKPTPAGQPEQYVTPSPDQA